MPLKDILVVSGQGGLFKYISQSRNNIIVENLSDNKRSSIPASTKISKLESIAVFTEGEDIYLPEVLVKIKTKENGGMTISHKSPDAELKRYFAEVLPQYAKDRVYVSDIRKIVMWYNRLVELGITDFEIPEEGEKVEKVEKVEEVEEEKVEGKEERT